MDRFTLKAKASRAAEESLNAAPVEI
jgi:hypothetical protein